ncbi:MAG: universal stress protein [Reyranellaceae bacterium]
MFRHILIPTDGSLLSGAAIDSAMAFARSCGAQVTVLAVVEPVKAWWGEAHGGPGAVAAPEDRVSYLDEAGRRAREAGVTCRLVQVEHDHPYEAIIATATQEGCDLIAMASHGRRGVAALVLGSETTKVLTHSTIPVLVYR